MLLLKYDRQEDLEVIKWEEVNHRRLESLRFVDFYSNLKELLRSGYCKNLNSSQSTQHHCRSQSRRNMPIVCGLQRLAGF